MILDLIVCEKKRFRIFRNLIGCVLGEPAASPAYFDQFGCPLTIISESNSVPGSRHLIYFALLICCVPFALPQS